MKKTNLIIIGFFLALVCSITLNNTNVYASKTTNLKATTYVGDVKTLSVKSKTYGKKIKGIKWKSANEKIATVNKNGKIIAKKKGTVTITGKYKKEKFKYKLKVKNQTKKSISNNYDKLLSYMITKGDFEDDDSLSITIRDNSEEICMLVVDTKYGTYSYSTLIYGEFNTYSFLSFNKSVKKAQYAFQTDENVKLITYINKSTYKSDKKLTFTDVWNTFSESDRLELEKSLNKLVRQDLKDLNTFLTNKVGVTLRGLGFTKYPI